MFLHVFDLTIYLHGFLLRSRFLSSSLPCVHVCLVYVNTIWTSVCSWITHDRYKIKAINVSWPGSLAILRQLFQLYPVNLPFCFRFSMKPKSIYFSGKTPVRHQNEAGLPSSISLLDPIWIPIYFFPPYPRPCPAFSRSVSKSCLWWKNCLHCRLRFSDYDLVIISETEYTQNTPFYSDFEFRWIAGHSWFEKIIESFLRALKHLTRSTTQTTGKEMRNICVTGQISFHAQLYYMLYWEDVRFT